MYNSARRISCRPIFAFLTASLFWIAASSIAQTQTASLGARQEFLKKLVAAAEDRTHHVVRYDPAYVRIPYPGGDVPGTPASAPTRSSVPIVPWESTSKKKSTRTWRRTSPRIRGSAGGSPHVRTQILTTAACRI